jgi:flavin reductase (DIM6/NTAB) family NADH-FMN oxidoreductase RutF
LHDLEGHETRQNLVIGQVVGVHLDESAIVDGIVDTAALNPVARLGGPADYSTLGEIFKMTRPGS